MDAPPVVPTAFDTHAQPGSLPMFPAARCVTHRPPRPFVRPAVGLRHHARSRSSNSKSASDKEIIPYNRQYTKDQPR